jgi:hypothetical protein
MAINTDRLNATASGKGFTPNSQNKAKRAAASDQPEPIAAPPIAPPAPAASTAIPTAREGAIALAATSHDAMSALQSAGLANAAGYVARKQQERAAIVDRVSDAIAYLSDPDLLESDILAAASAKVAARSGAWGYAGSDDLAAFELDFLSASVQPYALPAAR